MHVEISGFFSKIRKKYHFFVEKKMLIFTALGEIDMFFWNAYFLHLEHVLGDEI